MHYDKTRIAKSIVNTPCTIVPLIIEQHLTNLSKKCINQQEVKKILT
jgi:hypothetical protein